MERLAPDSADARLTSAPESPGTAPHAGARAEAGTIAVTTEAEHLLPIVLGVTGHRDIRGPDRSALERPVRELLLRIREQFPSSPVVLLSPLAEGADQLVARVFLEVLPPSRRRLLVPLPLPLDEYRRDFSTAGARELDELLGGGESMELPLLPGVSAADVASQGTARNRQYEQVGAFVARYSHLLLALWDGEASEKMGGTGQIVAFRLNGIPERYIPEAEPLDPPERGPVYHVHTPRARGTGGAEAAGTVRVLNPARGDPADGAAELLLQDLERFNADAIRLLRRFPAEVRRSAAYVYPDPPEAEPELSAAERRILRVYAAADGLAMRNQKRAKWILLLLLGVAVAVGAANQVYADIVPDRWMGIAYFLTIALGSAIVALANRAGWREKHFNYRAIAEGLRVQFFWRLGGLSASVASSYMRGHREDLQAIRQSLRCTELVPHDQAALAPEEQLKRIRAVQRRWIRDQRNYFLGDPERPGRRGAVARDTRQLWLTSLVSASAISVALVAIFALVVLDPHPDADWRDWVLAGSGTLLALTAASAGYSNVMGFSEKIRNGRKMGELFARADQRLNEALSGADETDDPAALRGRLEAARRVLLDIGKEALAENGDWMILHRERPLEFSPG